MNTVVHGAQLHSRYNPQAEAVRYIDSQNLKSGIECFILIEPGQGFIIPVLRERFKNSKIIALHVDGSFPAHDNVASLHGTNPSEIQAFLEKEVPDIDSSLVKIIEWRPSLNYYGEAYAKLLSGAIGFLKRAGAEKRTTAFFGRRWIRNFFKNLRNIEKILLYETTDIPIIITGSGPGLEAAIPVIKKTQNSCLILAASSSIMALAQNGIQADIVIATDGGPWALRHIYPYYRTTGSSIFAVNLCAALPSQCKDTPHLIINDGSFWQNIVLHELSLPSVIIPQKGTVTASAVELAMTLSGGNIYLAGIDLSVRDIRSHAKPYAFDSLIFERASRFAPVYSETFVRSDLIQNGGSMNIYAAWFKNQLSLWPKRIFSIGESRIFTNSLPPEHIGAKNTDEYFKTVSINKNTTDFYKRGISALLKAVNEKEYRENLKNELKPMLFPGENKVTVQEMCKAITDIADCYEKGCHE